MGEAAAAPVDARWIGALSALDLLAGELQITLDFTGPPRGVDRQHLLGRD
jgi:hypothetical protein